MITGIGTDILHLARLRNAIARRGAERFARRILSASELQEFTALRSSGGGDVAAGNDQGDGLRSLQTQFLASRWAAKEALYKAAYPTYRLTWKQIELYRDPTTGVKPFLRVSAPVLSAAEAERAAGDVGTRNQPVMDEVHDRIHVSLSHDADLVVAYVVLERVP